MRIPFTKMQGAGNDFVVLDETRGLFHLSPKQYQFLADRHLGVGADQILLVRAATQADIDFSYVIHNADGSEVEHCGNGARCFVRFVREQGLTQKKSIRVQVKKGVIQLNELEDGNVKVDMGPPILKWRDVPVDANHAQLIQDNQPSVWKLMLAQNLSVEVCAVSMGNPHAVMRVDDVDQAPVATQGLQIESHPAFAHRVNAGFMQIISRQRIKLRVFERGAGETLACGTGACAAVVAGIAQNWLDSVVQVQTRGGLLTIEWQGGRSPVWMSGPATTVFKGEIEIPV
jgi:diaminopimelate epimerase